MILYVFVLFIFFLFGYFNLLRQLRAGDLNHSSVFGGRPENSTAIKFSFIF